MATDAIVYCEVDPMPTIPDAAGTGPSIPVVIDITTAGSTAISALNLPAGVDITAEGWGGGGGGGAYADSSHGGGGGGGGAYVCITIPHDLVALGGTIVTGARGVGGASVTDDGTDGGDSTITIDSIVRVTAGKGAGGESTSHTGGAGGTGSIGAGVTLVTKRAGTDGGNGSGISGGAGGKAAVGGAGGGGAGGSGPSSAGTNGTAGRWRISYTPA